MVAKVLKQVLFGLLIFAGAGVAISVALARVPDLSDASFFQRVEENLTTYFTFAYTGSDGVGGNFSRLEVLRHASVLTFTLIGGALLMAFLLGVSTGMLSALKHGNRLVRAWTTSLHVLSATPILILSVILVSGALLFFGALPYRGNLENATGAGLLLIYLLPMLTLTLGDSMLSDVVRVTDTETTRILEQDYIRAARARNIDLKRHLLRGLAAPLVSTFASKAVYLIGGTAVVEYVFDWQGLGYQVLNILSRPGTKDYPFILAATALFVGIAIVLHLVSEIVTWISDPQLRSGTTIHEADL